jgi:outer membrane protein assembly factor BamB
MVMSISATAVAARPRPARFRRVVIPLFALALILIGFGLPRLWRWADYDPQPQFTIDSICSLAIPVGAMILLLWLAFLSGFRWRTRLAALGTLAALVGGLIACTDHVELTGDVGIIPVFKWEVRPQRADLSGGGGSEGLPPIDLKVDPVRDFPSYRGPHADGVVQGITLVKDWKARPPRELWRRPCGGGFAGFAVAGNVAVTIEQRGDNEVIVCLDAATGRERWAHTYEARFHHPTGDGPRATPTIADGDVYSLGATGWLVSLEGKTGKRKWGINILDDNQATNVQWALTGSPLVVGDRVLVNAGIDPEKNVGRALAAYDRQTGKRVWGSGNHRAGYSSPELAWLAGREQVLLFDGGGLAGFDPASGKELWQFPWESFNDQNIMQPLVFSPDKVYISSETTNGGVLLRVRAEGDKFTAEPVWANRQLCARYCNPVAVQGHVYGLSSGYLVCLEAETGTRRWRSKKKYDNGQLLGVGDVLLVQGEFQEVALVAADPEGFRELAQMRVSDAPKALNTPALAGNRLFLRNHLEMVCYELPVQPGPVAVGP